MIARYRRRLEKAFEAAPREVRDEAIKDANEFPGDEVYGKSPTIVPGTE